MRKVLIVVQGGIAELVAGPADVEVDIRDMDNAAAGDDWIKEFTNEEIKEAEDRDPGQYQFRIKEYGTSWDKIDGYSIHFQTRTQAMEFGRNLATLMGAEVRMDTGGSGTYIQPSRD